MMSENKEFITLYPSYWIYNAGIVGIIKSLPNKDSIIVNYNKIEIPSDNWEKLSEIFVDAMSKQFCSYQTKKERFPQPLYSSSSNDSIDEVKFWHNIFFSKNGLFSNRFDLKKVNQWIDKRLGEEKSNKSLKNLKKEIGNGNYSKEKINGYLKKLTFDQGKDLCMSLQSIVNEHISSKIKEQHDQNDISCQCSFCGSHTNNQMFFGLRVFNLEGGSVDKQKGFKNFFWKDSTQLPVCDKCLMVLYFSPLGIFPDLNYNQGEFINVPDIQSMWELNKYRMNVYLKRKENKWLGFDEKSKLIDALVSTGAYMRLKSKWLMQNIEIIEIGGKREDTVYNLKISPKPLKLLTDYTANSLIGWLNSIEKIKVKKPRKNHKIYNFTSGRDLIEKFLDGDSAGLLKIARILYKVYFEKVNNFDFLITYGLKPLLLVILSLEKGEEVHSDFLSLGRDFGRFFDTNQAKKEFESTFLNALTISLFSNNRKRFIEIVIRIFMKNGSAVDERLLSMQKMNDTVFQVEALLLITGILERLINKGD